MKKHLFWTLLILLSMSHFLNGSNVHGPEYDLEWTNKIQVFEYGGYRSVRIMMFDIPEHTTKAIWNIMGFHEPTTCDTIDVYVFFQHGSFPFITPFNESYPENFYVQRTGLQNKMIRTHNFQQGVVINDPLPGKWYLSAFHAGRNDRMSLKGIDKTCMYGISTTVMAKLQMKSMDITFKEIHRLSISSEPKIYRYFLPHSEYIYAYSASISSCKVQLNGIETSPSSCPILITISSKAISQDSQHKQNCSTEAQPCTLRVTSPDLDTWSYLTITLLHEGTVHFTIEFIPQVCDDYTKYEPSDVKGKPVLEVTNSSLTDNTTNSNFPQCIYLPRIGRYSILGTPFTTNFLFPNFLHIYPEAMNKVMVPGKLPLITSFEIHNQKDTGGTLKIQSLLLTDMVSLVQRVDIFICIMKDRIPDVDSVTNCSSGILLNLDSGKQRKTVGDVIIPYPEYGTWFISMRSKCYNKQNNTLEYCDELPIIKLNIYLSSCLDGQCGNYGGCQQRASGIHQFSTCNCYAGWRGYACTDGLEAESKSSILFGVYFLTFSNLFFIPAIIICIKRKYFVEGLVYAFNMFFSTFYHACDASKLYQYCMLEYNVVSFCDFYGSFLSFWITLITMSCIPDKLKTFLHMVGALAMVVIVRDDQHNTISFIVPTTIAGAFMIMTWIRQCYMRKECYPSKWNYLKFLLPGVLLAGTGLIIYSTFETENNYKYTHSVWHIVISLSIVFLLPHKDKKGTVLPISKSESTVGLQNCVVNNGDSEE